MTTSTTDGLPACFCQALISSSASTGPATAPASASASLPPTASSSPTATAVRVKFNIGSAESERNARSVTVPLNDRMAEPMIFVDGLASDVPSTMTSALSAAPSSAASRSVKSGLFILSQFTRGRLRAPRWLIIVKPASCRPSIIAASEMELKLDPNGLHQNRGDSCSNFCSAMRNKTLGSDVVARKIPASVNFFDIFLPDTVA